MAVKKDKKNAPLQEINLDPAVQAYMGQGEQAALNAQREKEQNLTAAQRRKRKQDQQRVRAYYDLPLAIKNRVIEIAEGEGVPTSQLAAFLLQHALQTYQAGEIDIAPYKRNSRVPRFEWMLALPEQD
jgi:hypothetical protein